MNNSHALGAHVISDFLTNKATAIAIAVIDAIVAKGVLATTQLRTQYTPELLFNFNFSH
jgi:hypothetical protein